MAVQESSLRLNMNSPGGSLITKTHAITGVDAAIFAVCLSTFLVRFGFGELNLIVPYHLASIGVPRTLIGIALSLNATVEMCTALPAGAMADKFGRSKMFLLGLFLVSLTLACFSLATEWWHFAMLCGFLGFGEAFTIAPALALLTDYTEVERRGRVMGFFDASVTLGYAAGPLAAGFLYEKFGHGITFQIASGMVIIAFVISAFLVRDVSRDVGHLGSKRSIIPSDADLSQYKRLFPLIVSWILAMFILAVGQVVIPMYAEAHNVGTGRLGIVMAAVCITLIASYVLFGAIADRVGRKIPMIFGLSVSTVSIMLMGITNTWESAEILLPMVAVGGGAFAPAALALLGDIAPERGRGVTMGIYDVVVATGMTMGPLFAGVISDLMGFGALFLMCSAITAANLVMVTFFVKMGDGGGKCAHRS
ncbi:MAG: MFS transporter [Candidatus Baldrarchaeia archaeon]